MRYIYDAVVPRCRCRRPHHRRNLTTTGRYYGPHLRRLICDRVSDFPLHIAGNLVEGFWSLAFSMGRFSTRAISHSRCNRDAAAPAIMTSGKLCTMVYGMILFIVTHNNISAR